MADNEKGAAIVTGGARGIGRATSEALAAAGYAVVVADRDPEAAESAAAELRQAGHRALGVQTDVADRASVTNMVAAAISEFGTVDVLVNNAGIAGKAAPIAEQTDADWDLMMAVDLKSVYLCCQAVLPHMLERKYGSIVNVASIAGKDGNPNMVPYSTAKAGVIGLTKSLGKEVAQQGVRVNAVAPAVIGTEILLQLTQAQIDYMTSKIPMGRLGKPEEVAAIITFLASDASSFVTAQCYDVSGGRATY
jgi:3-oxoacyl-[acyl-carrier protein] reductase